MATITAAPGGGNWNVGATWVGGVAPTAADDVLLAATSGNVTIPAATTVACRSLDCTGYAGTLTFAASTSVLNVGDASGGAFKLSAGMTLTLTGLGTIGFVSTSSNGGTGWGITTAGKTLPNLSVSGVGGKWVMQDALAASGAFNHTGGELVTNNFSFTAASWTESNVGARALTLGTSTFTINGTGNPINVTTTGLTFSGATSTLVVTSATAFSLNLPALAFGTVTLSSSAPTITVAAGATFTTLTINGAASKTQAVSLAGNVAVTTSLSMNGNSLTNRLLVASSVIGTQRTITAAAIGSLSNVDFMDVAGAGAAAPFAGASIGDALGNSGITFTASVTRYAVVAGNWSNTATWSAASGGAGGASVPLPQDAVILDANSGAGTYAIDMPRIGKDITMTGFIRTLSFSTATKNYGSVTFASGMTVVGTGTLLLGGRGAHTFTSAGKTMTGPVFIDAPMTSWTLQDAFSGTRFGFNANTYTGTLDANNFAVTLSQDFFTSTAGTTAMGSGTWTFTTTSSINFFTGGGTITGTATIVLAVASASTRTFAGGGKTYGTLRYTVAASTGALILTGANAFGTLDIQGGGRTLTLPASTTTTVTTLLRLLGTNAGSPLTVNSSTPGTKAKLSVPLAATNDTQFVALVDQDADGTAAPLTAYDSTAATTIDWIPTDRKSGADAADVSITAAVSASVVAEATDQAQLAIVDATMMAVTAEAVDGIDLSIDEDRDLRVFADAVDQVVLELDDSAEIFASLNALDALNLAVTGGGIALITPAALDAVDLELAEAALAEWLHSIGCMAVETRLVTRMTVTLTLCEGPPMDEDPEEGSLVAIDVSITDEETGVPVDPTELRFVVEDPDGTEAEPDIVHDAVGAYHVDVVLSAPGRWRWRWWSAGVGQASKSGRIDVRRATVNA